MNLRQAHLWSGVFLLLLLHTYQIQGQEPLIKYDIKKEFAKAEDFMNSFKNDSANLILVELIDQLTKRKELDTPFGLKVQVRQAEALEKDHADEIAIEKLLFLVDASEQQKQWDVFTNAHLSLARLHEKLDREASCLNNLRQAARAIKSHSLDSIYPRFSIRMSSYHRLFSDVDSAMFYAKEVLRTAPIFELYEQEAVGHLLAGLLLGNSSYQEAASHFKAAGETWLKLDNYSGYGAVMSNLSTLYLKENKTRLALSYNDSALAAAAKAAAMGNEGRWMYYKNYKKRADIYRAMGQSDSAWHYLDKGYNMELDDVYQSNHSKVIEIDARYKDEKKAQKITQQAEEISYAKERRNLLIGIIFLILLLALLLIYYTALLRKANKKTKSLALLINKTNKDLSDSLRQQIILQGEVHHRVKNNLQVIISLLELQMEEIEDPAVRKNFEAMSNRIYSMAAIHEILYQQEGTTDVNLHDYIENLCMHFSNFSAPQDKLLYQLDLKNQHFNLETSMPLGIIMTELLTNSIKYGRVKAQQLRVSVSLKQLTDSYHLKYKDNGPGFPTGKLEEREGGLGTYLLKSMVRQLSGNMESSNHEGAQYDIYFKKKTA